MAAATVTLLTSGTQALEGTGDAVDISNNAQVRMTISAAVDHGQDPDLSVWFETAPSSSGPWREIERVRMMPGSSSYPWNSAKRVVLPAADNFLKVAWSLRYRNATTPPQTFTLGVSGTAVVSA